MPQAAFGQQEGWGGSSEDALTFASGEVREGEESPGWAEREMQESVCVDLGGDVARDAGALVAGCPG